MLTELRGLDMIINSNCYQFYFPKYNKDSSSTNFYSSFSFFKVLSQLRYAHQAFISPSHVLIPWKAQKTIFTYQTGPFHITTQNPSLESCIGYEPRKDPAKNIIKKSNCNCGCFQPKQNLIKQIGITLRVIVVSFGFDISLANSMEKIMSGQMIKSKA